MELKAALGGWTVDHVDRLPEVEGRQGVSLVTCPGKEKQY